MVDVDDIVDMIHMISFLCICIHRCVVSYELLKRVTIMRSAVQLNYNRASSLFRRDNQYLKKRETQSQSIKDCRRDSRDLADHFKCCWYFLIYEIVEARVLTSMLKEHFILRNIYASRQGKILNHICVTPCCMKKFLKQAAAIITCSVV